ncbi:MAG: hypothetical protein M1834_007035 [Cirrosporium novae-zelandiae]|nr:MAG: hypothetical protein M1834_007035 [Cirrosporium novae-zelandiae]
MVSIEAIRASNSKLKNLPSGLVALFVGGTSGIGESTLKAFYSSTLKPRVYFVGRNETAASRIIDELKQLNADGQATFLKKDISLIKNVDEVCEEMKTKESKLNLLFMTSGFLTMKGRNETSEGLDSKMVAHCYARMRFAMNMQPLLTAAAQQSELSRVVSVLDPEAPSKLILEDLDLKTHFSLRNCVTHTVMMTNFIVEELAKRNPSTSYVHAHPGIVKTNAFRDGGLLLRVGGELAYQLIRPWTIGIKESGERHLYASTSGAFPPKNGDTGTVAVGKTEIATGSNGEVGSGAYLLSSDATNKAQVDMLRKYREEGVSEKIWEHVSSTLDGAAKRN